MSRWLTSPTWISPTRTANFILIFRIGSDGLMSPVGRTTEPAPDIIAVSAGRAETAAACCPWPGGGRRFESIVTGLSLVISSLTGRFQGLVIRFAPVMLLITAVEHKKKWKTRTLAKPRKTKTKATLCQETSTREAFGERVRRVDGGSRLSELTDLRCSHKAACVCAPLSYRPCCCHRHVAAPCLRYGVAPRTTPAPAERETDLLHRPLSKSP